MINFNGKILENEALFLNQKNRGLKYGDALFETIKVVNSKIFFLEDHYFRLMASMRILRMKIPENFTMEFIENQIFKLIENTNLNNSAVRIRLTVFRHSDGLYLPITNEVSYIIEAALIDSPFYLFNDQPYEIELFKDHLVNSGLLSTLKSNNRIINVLGSIYAKENNYDNCLLLNEDKNVIEALNGNVFLVNGNQIITPPKSDGCINGIIRKQLIEIIKKTEDYLFEERSISPFELQKADELFITNVIIGIQNVSKYRKKTFKKEISKDLLNKLNVQARLV